MTKAPIGLQELRRRIYRKAKSKTTHRFWGLFVHVTKMETLEEAYRIAKGNGGAPGIVNGSSTSPTAGKSPCARTTHTGSSLPTYLPAISSISWSK